MHRGDAESAVAAPLCRRTPHDGGLQLAQESKGHDTHGYRAEFINLLGKAKALKR